MSHGIVLFGPPGVGKDTVTVALSRLSANYELFRRLKAGPGRTAGYRVTTPQHIRELSDAGEIIYLNLRYGAEYAVDRAELHSILDRGHTPIVHLGQMTGVEQVSSFPTNWTTVLMWCSRETTRERCLARGSIDVENRLSAWDATLEDLLTYGESSWSLIIDTDEISAKRAALLVQGAMTEPPKPTVLNPSWLTGNK